MKRAIHDLEANDDPIIALAYDMMMQQAAEENVTYLHFSLQKFI